MSDANSNFSSAQIHSKTNVLLCGGTGLSGSSWAVDLVTGDLNTFCLSPKSFS